ncbi:flap endonuclease GEN [Copidosoma floridanum]|uniref:flap endonuclease GEN n=1 Tax=Copidosoma floridanum TaxID=29053 RepID=UPI0006C9415F|nr:flap endonuclease GEN [Copidosoma floridanum]
MGVKDLWNIISPLSERKPLFELEGKTIAIDLSCWVVDSQNVSTQPKIHVRNLCFRTSYFLLHNINPVFVLEGTAPKLKHDTIARRNEVIRPGAADKKKSKKVGRTHFNTVLRECQEMLRYMGLECIQGKGEAEALCAYLNADGLVDGCITQDSDCFLYGAKVVYRNFCTVKQNSSGFIDEYDIEKIQNVHGLGRNKMVALALICGCDYGEGLYGVGKENALKFFKTVSDSEVLDRMKKWKTNSVLQRIDDKLADPDTCPNCGHLGKKTHNRKGCLDCGTTEKCNDSFKKKCVELSGELAIRKKALMDENFPNQEIIDEFLLRKESVPSSLNLKWRKPNMIKFVSFMERVVQWDAAYALSKILPIFTRWQIKHLIDIPEDERADEPNIIIPERIKKVKTVKGVPSFEILWQDNLDIVKKLDVVYTEDKENNEEPQVFELITVEPQELIEKCYPQLYDQYLASIQAKKAPKLKRTREPKKPKKDVIKNKKITDYIVMNELEESFEKMVVSPKKKRGPQFDKVMATAETDRLDKILNGSLEVLFNDLGPDDFPVENDIPDAEISLIIQNIVSRKY